VNTLTEKILCKDTLAETERIFGGKHWSEFNDSEQEFSFAKAIVDNVAKDEYFKNIGDTHFSMSWDEFKRLIKQHGFIPALEYDIQGESVNEAIIYYHPQKGLIIFATSYSEKRTVNSGNLYG